MSWHELRILRDDTERENLRKQTADNLPLETPPSSKVNAPPTKLSVKEKYRRSLLGKLAKDLDYLETLITSVTLADDETINYSFTRTTNHKSSLPRSRSLGNIGSSKKDYQELFEIMDVNRDGKIDYDEFIRAGYNRSKLINLKNLKIAFDSIDYNGDGAIDI